MYKSIIFKDFNIGIKARGRCGVDFFALKKFPYCKKPNIFDIHYNCAFILNHPLWQSHCSYNIETEGVLRNERFNDEIKKEMRGGFRA
jgi:hypothetical protein